MLAKTIGILRDYREILPPISKEGIDASEVHSEGYKGHVSAEEFGPNEQRPEEFTPSTVILSNGYGKWELNVPKYIRKRMTSALLRIDTIRTHGMLHSPVQWSEASLHFNEKLVDKIYLVKPHPHGEDYGVDSRRPFQIIKFIDKSKDTQIITIGLAKAFRGTLMRCP